MASSAKDIQLRELKDTISQLNTIMSEQTELIRSLRTIIEEKTAHEMVLQEQVDYLTKKLSFIAPVEVMAGEFEMEALAAGACRVLAGEEKPHAFSELV